MDAVNYITNGSIGGISSAVDTDITTESLSACAVQPWHLTSVATTAWHQSDQMSSDGKKHKYHASSATLETKRGQ
jgi:hypothetical protein